MKLVAVALILSSSVCWAENANLVSTFFYGKGGGPIPIITDLTNKPEIGSCLFYQDKVVGKVIATSGSDNNWSVQVTDDITPFIKNVKDPVLRFEPCDKPVS